GYSGTISGALRNDGPRSVSDAVLVIEPVSDSIAIDERRFALPELDAGETTAFAYQTDISGQADAGPRQVRFTVEYGGDGTEPVRVGPLNERVVVDTQRAEFSVTGVQTRVSAGGTTDLVLEITNERPETLSNVNAKLFTDSPFDSDSDEAFVDELEPGASAEIVFSLSAEEDVMPKAYPVELDFQYDTERGDSVLSDTYQQSVTVTEPDDTDSGLPFGSILTSIGVLLLVGGAVGLAYMIRVRE
ncbi:MAG: COG1361 S-layer family protein, partial [Halobacteriota archaeon]